MLLQAVFFEPNNVVAYTNIWDWRSRTLEEAEQKFLAHAEENNISLLFIMKRNAFGGMETVKTYAYNWEI